MLSSPEADVAPNITVCSELLAMQRVMEIFEHISSAEQQRVVWWLADRYDIKLVE